MPTVGWIKVGLSADTAAFVAGMKTAASTVGKFGSAVAAKLGPVAAPFKYLASWGDALAYKFGPPLKAAVGGTFAYFKNWGSTLSYMYGDKVSAAFGLMGRGIRTAAGAMMRFGGAVGRTAQAGVMRLADGLRMTGHALDTVYGGMKRTVTQIGMFGAAAGVAAGVGIAKIVNKAADLTEALNLVKVQFGDNADVIIKESELISGAVGTSRTEFLGMAGAMSAVFAGTGMGEKQIAEVSAQFSRLALDTESLYNLQKGAAFEKIMSGLTGQIRPLREIGVLIDDNKVQAQAYAMGLAKAGEEVSQEQKVLARIPLILQGLSKAQGDRARTAADTKNATREVEGRMLSLAETIGKVLDPIAKSVLSDMNTALGALQMYWVDNQNQVSQWAGATVGGVGQATQSVGMLQQVIMSVADAWRSVQTAFMKAQVSTTSGVSWMVKNLPGFAEGVNKLMGGTKGSEKAFKQNWLADLEGIQKEQERTLGATEAKPMPSAVITDYFNKAKLQADALRGELLAKPVLAPATVGHGLEAVKKAEKEKPTKMFAGALEMGSAGAYSSILEAQSRMQYGKDRNQERIAKNTDEMAIDMKAVAVGVTKLAAVLGTAGGDLAYQASAGL